MTPYEAMAKTAARLFNKKTRKLERTNKKLQAENRKLDTNVNCIASNLGAALQEVRKIRNLKNK